MYFHIPNLLIKFVAIVCKHIEHGRFALQKIVSVKPQTPLQGQAVIKTHKDRIL